MRGHLPRGAPTVCVQAHVGRATNCHASMTVGMRAGATSLRDLLYTCSHSAGSTLPVVKTEHPLAHHCDVPLTAHHPLNRERGASLSKHTSVAIQVRGCSLNPKLRLKQVADAKAPASRTTARAQHGRDAHCRAASTAQVGDTARKHHKLQCSAHAFPNQRQSCAVKLKSGVRCGAVHKDGADGYGMADGGPRGRRRAPRTARRCAARHRTAAPTLRSRNVARKQQ